MSRLGDGNRSMDDIEGESLIENGKSMKTKVDEGKTTLCGCRCSHLGIMYATLSGLFFGITTVIVKTLSHLHPFQLSFFRLFSFFVGGGVMCCVNKHKPFPTEHRVDLLARAVSGFLFTALDYYAMQHMAVGDATAIVFSSPVFVAIVARIMLKEALDLVTLTSILLTLIGVVLVSQPTFIFRYINTSPGESPNELVGIAAAYGCLALSSLTYVLVRKLRFVHTGVILLNFGAISVPLNLLVLGLVGRFQIPYSLQEVLLLSALTVFSFLAQTAQILASKLEKASVVAVGRSSAIIVNFLFQVFWFHDNTTVLDTAGIFLIIMSLVAIAVYKWKYPNEDVKDPAIQNKIQN